MIVFQGYKTTFDEHCKSTNGISERAAVLSFGWMGGSAITDAACSGHWTLVACELFTCPGMVVASCSRCMKAWRNEATELLVAPPKKRAFVR